MHYSRYLSERFCFDLSGLCLSSLGGGVRLIVSRFSECVAVILHRALFTTQGADGREDGVGMGREGGSAVTFILPCVFRLKSERASARKRELV